MIRSIDELRPEARTVAQGFLDAAAEATARGLRAGVREDLATHLCERLEPTSTAADVEELLAGLRPEDIAGRRGTRWPPGLRVNGLLARIAETWWRPSDPRLFLPRAVGTIWSAARRCRPGWLPTGTPRAGPITGCPSVAPRRPISR